MKLSPVEPLIRTHQIDEFDCGSAAQSEWLRRVNAAADLIGVRALLIHCESARAFYLKPAQFDESPTDPLHLLLVLKDLRKALT
ncbi:hypothetical protein [Actinomadura sp. HBU206391]|uniref:hypothetical protein n=1 Tax=Actinomadura sp. HBU206391 TaxID=2731692 RepID=UPI0016502343|nr:hypothetical protein [Actinomadura sp. HBU206391]MBC6460196.1 hypothetical protein [Actinomadura sp. HBU206391]